MSDGVSFIFKTLIKVPVYTVIVYLVFNCFTFGSAYFKMLGASHTIEMMVLEDNYLTDTTRNILISGSDTSTSGNPSSFLGTLVTKITPEVYIIDGVSGTNDNNIVTESSLNNMFTISAIPKFSVNNSAKDSAGVNYVRAYAKANGSGTVVNAGGGSALDHRTQFGTIRVCGLIWKYKFVLPLIPTELNPSYTAGNKNNINAVGGLNGFLNNTDDIELQYGNGGQIETKLKAKEEVGTITIQFLFKVPGLKYYADMG